MARSRAVGNCRSSSRASTISHHTRTFRAHLTVDLHRTPLGRTVALPARSAPRASGGGKPAGGAPQQLGVRRRSSLLIPLPHGLTVDAIRNHSRPARDHPVEPRDQRVQSDAPFPIQRAPPQSTSSQRSPRSSASTTALRCTRSRAAFEDRQMPGGQWERGCSRSSACPLRLVAAAERNSSKRLGTWSNQRRS